MVGGPTEMGCSYPPTKGDQPSPDCANITEQGPPVPVNNPGAMKACPAWRDGIPNLKSSGVRTRAHTPHTLDLPAVHTDL